MGDFTASGAERAIACPASAALPQVLSTNEDAERGDEIHAYNKRHLQGRISPEENLALVPKEYRHTCAGIDFKRILGGRRDLRAEVAYSINVRDDEAQEIGVDIDRRYPATPAHVICGTLDIESTCLDDVPSVDDWKTGRHEVTECRHNLQMMFGARARQLLTGADLVRARILYVRENGRVDIDDAEFTRFELDGYVDELAAGARAVGIARELLASGGMPTVSTGDHCRYCGAMSVCPAYTALARTMAPDLAAIEERIRALSPAEGGAAWRKAKDCGRLVDRVVEALNALSYRHPLPTRPGKEVRPIGARKNYFRKDRVLTLLSDLGATPAQVQACFEEVIETQHREVNSR